MGVVNFKRFRGYLRKRTYFLRFFLDFPDAVWALRRKTHAEKGQKWPTLADFQEGRVDALQAPICYICGSSRKGHDSVPEDFGNIPWKGPKGIPRTGIERTKYPENTLEIRPVAVSGAYLEVSEENSGKVTGKLLEKSPMLSSKGFQAQGKANLPGSLGRDCPGPCPHLLCGCFF